MADEKLIGQGACPVCGNAKARFTVSKKQLCCMTCNACNVQIFARSDNSDEKLRACIKAPAAEPAPAAPAPAKAEAKAPPEAPAPAEKKPAPSWGFMGAIA